MNRVHGGDLVCPEILGCSQARPVAFGKCCDRSMNVATSRAGRALLWVGGVLAVLLALAVAHFLQTRLDRELSDLPDSERRVLYHRTLETLRTTCRQPPGPQMAEHCRQEAEFVLRFPECDSECRELATRFIRRPSR
jgi:cytochrome b pre-mRNA-processing protein 3